MYRQAPYQDCTEEEYNEALGNMPKNVDWAELSKYESQDYTVSSQELACVAGGCEVIYERRNEKGGLDYVGSNDGILYKRIRLGST